MSLKPRIIIFIVLCSFTFTTTAAATLCSLSMSDMTDTQQVTEDTAKENCHNDKKNSVNDLLEDCCQDMNSCGTTIYLFSKLFSSKVQINQYTAQLSPDGYIVLNITSPPVPPPKLNS